MGEGIPHAARTPQIYQRLLRIGRSSRSRRTTAPPRRGHRPRCRRDPRGEVAVVPSGSQTSLGVGLVLSLPRGHRGTYGPPRQNQS